jgi:hypothetical protein
MTNDLKKLYTLMLNRSTRRIIGPMKALKNPHILRLTIQYTTDGIWYERAHMKLRANDE